MNINFNFLLIGTSLSLIPNLTRAQCAVTDCQQLGYTSLQKCDNGLKCPFGEYWACPKVTKAELGSCNGYAQNCKIGQILNNDGLRHATTGYLFRKGASFHNSMRVDSKNSTACPSYRATEALLNYMEASYEHTGILDASAREYWMLLRQRAYINGPLENTINNTIMEKEAENDWAAYSGGKLIDATLYNIRRERRCEFLSEGLRYMDLCRWRSMDQWLTKKYLVEGFHLWNTPMENYYIDAQTGKSELVADRSDKANVSPQSISEYLCPFEISNEQKGAGGLVWHKAHYLYPLPIDQFQLTAPDNQTISDSPLYQNPYWPAVPDEGAEQ